MKIPSRRSKSNSHLNRFLLLAGAAGWLLAAQAAAQSDGFRVVQPTPGGIDPHPYITSITQTQGLQIHWFGFQGPYQVQRTTNLNVAPWLNVGLPTSGNSATLPGLPGNQFHRVTGGAPGYQGIGVCSDCHDTSAWDNTRHAKAFDTLKRIGQHTNPECVVCHTVGANVSGGFINETTTPHLTAVQCENCHGPAGNHVANDPPTAYPVTTSSAMLCGGCHNGFHHPTYDEWTTSPHSAVVAELAEEFEDPNRAAAVGRMNACGACHSGAVRLSMLKAYSSNNRTNVSWPTGHEAAETPTTCIVCHESHRVRVYTNVLTRALYTNQLRNPISSTNVFSYNTSLPFASNYNAAVSVCGQCHNARGASVSSSGRPPHYSPQYNIFLGVIGVTTNGTAPPQGAHKSQALQCAGCHTHGHNGETPSEQDPAYTGHAFRATIEACAACHTATTGPTSPTNLLFSTQAEISALISTTKNLLDLWGKTKNTATWAWKYEERSWEYTSPGELSNPSGSSSITGPTSTEQADIPQGIKDARFNLYLVNRDKSLGIHNAPYTRYLLGVAQQRVNAELAK